MGVLFLFLDVAGAGHARVERRQIAGGEAFVGVDNDFVFFLFDALVYAWRKDALEWV